MGLRDLFRRPGATESAATTDVAVGSAAAPASHVEPGSPSEPRSGADSLADGAPVDVVRFRSFAWKLAVMQRLMYDDDAVLPAFTMPPSLHPGAPVEDWFRGYQLPASSVAALTSVHFSRTAEVLRQLDPHWDATDARFDVDEVGPRDLEALPALVQVTDPEGMLSGSVRAALISRGITVS